MRFKHIGDNKETWWIPISIPAKEMSDSLQPKDRARYLDFEIHIHIEVSPTPEGGIFEYAGEWALPPVGNYPTRIIEAIEKYISSIHVEERFGDAIRSETRKR